MKRTVIMFFWVCLAILSVVSDGWTGQASLDVAKVRTDEGVSPDTCYELLRNGKPVKPLIQNMRICNGDVIIPHKGKSVTLIYRHSDCGENGKTILTEKTVVNCNPATYRRPGWLAEQVSEFVKGVKEKTGSEPLNEIDASSRAGWDLDELQFFPVNGTTILYKSDICFKWKGKECLSDSDAKLVIYPEGKNADKLITKDIKTDNLVCLHDDFQAGVSYQWHVEINGKKVSDIYNFRILEKEASENIRSQLAELENAYKNESPGLKQALYLQFISDATPGLDLYAESLRLMLESKEQCKGELPLLNELFERLFIHAGIYPVEWKIVINPVADCKKYEDCLIPPATEQMIENGPCAGKKYYQVHEIRNWNEMGKESVAVCSVISFILKNISANKTGYYCNILNINPNGKAEVIFPADGQKPDDGLIQFAETLNLCSKIPLLLENKGDNTFRLVISKRPIEYSRLEQLEIQADWRVMEFSIDVK